MQKIACGVEYFSDLNSPYCGFQKQPHAPSIQEELEKAFSAVANHPVEIFTAGRTDRGVHALGQVIHFETETLRSPEIWVRAVNAHLPKSIRIQFAQEVPDDFHARYSARARRYEYWIENQKIPSVFSQQQALNYYFYLDSEKMHQAAQCLLGEQDFSAFRSSECQSKTPVRTINFINISRQGNNFIKIDIEANAFLHHMVRNIVGSLLMIGDGRKDKNFLRFLLDQKDRTLAGMTVEPQGLYLIEVTYPDRFEIPKMTLSRRINLS